MSDSEEEVLETQIKLIFVGEPNVGKTSIIQRFCYDEFMRSYNQTQGADFYIKRITLPGKRDVAVRITDVGGLEMNGHMLGNYLFNSDMVLLVYDITNFSSFERLFLWIQQISKHNESPPFVAIFGNKCDMEHKRVVRLDQIQHFVEEFQLFNFLVSAKTGENIVFVVLDCGYYKKTKNVTIYLKPTAISMKYFDNFCVINISRKSNCYTYIIEFKKEACRITEKVIEKYTENIRFCIICNYLSKIIPALQSRCTRFRFGPLTSEQILPRLNYVVDEEKVKISEDGKKALLTLANGDMRKVLNVLQSTWLAYKDVTEDNVYSCVGHPLRSDIENIVKWLLNENIATTYKNMKELKILKGLALSDIITEVHKYVLRIELPFEIMVKLLDKLAEIEHRLAAGTSENIQLSALISAFHYAKQINVPESS